MFFDQSDLRQLTPEYIDKLNSQRKSALIEQMRADLMRAHDRLNQNSSNSSRPPSSDAPWEGSAHGGQKDQQKEQADTEQEQDEAQHTEDSKEPDQKADEEKKKRKPGRQPGSKGFGRTQHLSVTHIEEHRPDCCKGCGRDLSDQPFYKQGGHYTLDLTLPEEGKAGLQVTNTKHIYGMVLCPCGFEAKTAPVRISKEEGWNVELGEYRLVGNRLQAFIVFLKMRLHLTMSKIRELLYVWLNLSLSEGTINQTIREAGRAASSLEPQILELLKASPLLHLDETSWHEHKYHRWLWTAVGEGVTYYTTGPRTKAVAEEILKGFVGLLMTDGYGAYRHYENRLRCWAHLGRKAHGLATSWSPEAETFGHFVVSTLQDLREGVYRMRKLEPESRKKEQEASDDKRIQLIFECLRREKSGHEPTRALAVEILNDHKTIFRVLKEPELPLTNNAAERALRQYVVMRNISHGSKTAEGSYVIAILASVIDTLRARVGATCENGYLVWQYMALLFRMLRSGLSPPDLLPLST